MNNKGMTVIELVVSFVLTIVIALFLIEIVFFLKDIYVTNGIKSEIILKQSLISDRINKIFNSKRISNISNCGDDCISVMFNDSSVETISFDKKSNKVIIGDYVNNLPNGSVIGETVMKTTVNDTEINCFNSLFQIYVPITNVLVKNKVFDINIVYQYDNRKENWSYNNPNKNTMVKEFVYTGNYQTFV
ncbi:MAG: hypothetical protein RR050_03885, partial [Bacilli bacterium]